MQMKLGKPNTPPQPEYADYIAVRYDAKLPGCGIADGVKAGIRKSIFVHTNPYDGISKVLKAIA